MNEILESFQPMFKMLWGTMGSDPMVGSAVLSLLRRRDGPSQAQGRRQVVLRLQVIS